MSSMSRDQSVKATSDSNNRDMSRHRYWGLILLLPALCVSAAIYVVVRSEAFDQEACIARLPSEYADNADLIITGEVFAVVPEETTGATVLITPLRVYHGVLPERGVDIASRVGTPSTSDGSPKDNSMGELHFASGQPPYLLYLREGDDGRYRTSACDGSRSIPGGLTAQEQALLGEGEEVPQR